MFFDTFHSEIVDTTITGMCCDKKGSYDSTLRVHSLPERSGIFSVDRAAVRLSICPWHRDFFGIYWRNNSTKCQFKGHPADSKAKADRGTTPTLSKEYWLLKRELIPVGSGLCKQCSTKIRQTVADGGIKVDTQEDVDLYQFMQVKMACTINVEEEKVCEENKSDGDESTFVPYILFCLFFQRTEKSLKKTETRKLVRPKVRRKHTKQSFGY